MAYKEAIADFLAVPRPALKKLVIAGVFCAAAALLFVQAVQQNQPLRIVSAAGLVCMNGLGYLFSHDRASIKLKPVLGGVTIQLFMGILILRTKPGFTAFDFIGRQMAAFLAYSEEGAQFIFAVEDLNLTTAGIFAFSVLPTIIWFSAIVQILYYFGTIGYVIKKIGFGLQIILGTTAPESMSAAGNIFLGQTEAPLLIRPFLPDMTKSELHAVMTGGFATIAGSVLAAFISFGIPPNNLIAASVMNAPAALAMSKLVYPETEISRFAHNPHARGGGDRVSKILSIGQDRGVIEALLNGASQAISLVANIAAMLIAFISFIYFVNNILSFLGTVVGVPDLSFQYICGYLLWPLALVMGVPPEDCRAVAELIGEKTFINEFVAYTSLSAKVQAGTITKRGELIATFALCGFSNLASIGVQVGGLSPMAPHRKRDLVDISFRALLAGCLACFSTACVAGMFADDLDD
jgi:pyrimidine nucleoside transport protein